MPRKYSDKNSKKLIKPIFEKRFKSILSDEDYKRFVCSISMPMKKSFRINLNKCKNPKILIENLQKKGLNLKPIPWVNNAYFVEYENTQRVDLGNLVEHFLGEIYIQEATSLIPITLLELPENIQPQFKVLDMCASPGSKTTQMADVMEGRGIIVANEKDYKRLGPLKINIERAGFTNIVITHSDGRNIRGEERFDRILLDAPCSGSGVIRKSPTTLKNLQPK